MPLNIFGNNCPHCNKTVPSGASFCPHCGGALSGGTRRCGKCGTMNRSDAVYCKKCGEELARSAAPEITRHRWARGEKDFAVRVEADDLPGILRHGLVVEPGVNAMLIVQGVNQGVMPPGQYQLENVLQKMVDTVLTGIPERATFLLVDITPTELLFHLGGRFTRDPLPIGITVRMNVEVGEPGKFLVNFFKNRERLSKDDLREYLYPEVVQVADAWLCKYSLEELSVDPLKRAELEMGLEEALKTSLRGMGLRFLQVRTVELNLEPYDEVKGLRADKSMLIYKAEAQAELDEARVDYEIRKAQADADSIKRYAIVNYQVNLQELEELTRKVELEERKLEINARLRRAIKGDEMGDIRSEADFVKFLDGIDREKLLTAKEHDDLVRTYMEEAEDHSKARAHLLAKLDVEQKFEIEMRQLRMKGEVSQQELDQFIAWHEKYQDFGIKQRRELAMEEIQLAEERKQGELAVAKTQREIDLIKLSTEYDADMQSLQLLEKTLQLDRLDKEELLRIDRENAIKTKQADLDIEIRRMEAQEVIHAAERAHELERMKLLGSMGTEALIAMADTSEKARLLADLKHTEALKGMSEEQILAMAAKDSPQVALAFQEKFRAVAAGEASAREKEMYERLLSEQKDGQKLLQEIANQRVRETTEAWDRASQRAKETTERALDRMADTSKAFASGSGGTPVIVVPGAMGPQVIHPMGGAVGGAGVRPGAKTCPNCGRFVPEDAAFCVHCGNKFEGVS